MSNRENVYIRPDKDIAHVHYTGRAKKKSMKLKRYLEDTEVEETSFVDQPANLRKFFFIKNDEVSEEFTLEKGNTSITIVSDGSEKGTSVTINGKAVSNLTEFFFGFYKQPDRPEGAVGQVVCNYTVESKGESKGFKSTRSYRLAKAKSTENLEVIKQFVGADDDLQINELAGDEIAKNIRVLREYQDAFPPEVMESLKSLVTISAVSKDVVVDNEDKTEIDKGEEKMAEEKDEKVEQKEENKTETSASETGFDTAKVAAEVAELLKPTITETVKEQFAAAKEEQDKQESGNEEVTLTANELEQLVTESVEAALTSNE